jgi:hypothetical protein
LPDVSNCFREIAHASDRQATLHGVVFDILGTRAAQAMRLACRAGAGGRSVFVQVSFGVAALLALAGTNMITITAS